MRQCLKENHRKKGVIGRMGGDEFATMLLTDDDEEGAGLQKTMGKLIEEYNDSSEKPYRLSTSLQMKERRRSSHKNLRNTPASFC